MPVHFEAGAFLRKLAGFLFELFFELRKPSVGELGGLLEVTLALRDLALRSHSLDRLFDLRDLLDRVLFFTPDVFQLARLVLQPRDFRLEVFQAALARIVTLLLERLALDLELQQAAVELIDFFRHGVDLHPDLGRGFVHQIDRLIR